MRRVSNAVFGLMLAAIAGSACAQGAPQKIAGTVLRYNAGSLQITTAAGAQETASVTDRTRISWRAASDVSQIRPGSFVGATAAPRADGTLVASEVHIFPESMRGTGEGHRPMTGANSMTNATVAGVSGARAPSSSMTNATVANVGGAGAELKLSLTYKGGEQLIVVPRGIPIMTLGVGTASLLVPGAHVIVYGSTQPDGSIAADRISVGKDGYVPPL